jgi:hypothetical protein
MGKEDMTEIDTRAWSRPTTAIVWSEVLATSPGVEDLSDPTWDAESKSHSWIAPTARQVATLLKLRENWDSYGSAPIRRDTAYALIDVLAGIMGPNSPAPAVVPSPDGHLQAEWHTNGIDLEVEVMDASRVEVTYSKGQSTWHRLLRHDLTELVRAVDELTA